MTPPRRRSPSRGTRKATKGRPTGSAAPPAAPAPGVLASPARLRSRRPPHARPAPEADPRPAPAPVSLGKLARRAGSAPAEPNDIHASLVRKYHDLQLKHARLVEQQRTRMSETVSLMALSSWALETHTSGLLLISEGHIRVSNPRWDALTHLGGGRLAWRQLDAEGEPVGPALPGLRDAALHEAELVLLATERSVRTARYTPEGRSEAVELRVEHLVRRGGRHVAVLLAHDVTAQRAAERELRELRETSATRERMRALGEVVAGVTHDLNNTLQAMRLRLQLLQADPAVVAAQGAALETLLQIVADARGRVDRLHDFARRRPPSAPMAVDLMQVVREAVELVHTEFATVPLRDGGIPVQVSVELPERMPRVRGWPAELRYVLLNLLLNARDAMPDGGTIWVRAELRDEQHLLLSVEDEGTGILPEHLTRIFEPLFTTKREANSGLGLSMAYGVMERLGGRIRALNRPEGGARFELLFPRAPSPAS